MVMKEETPQAKALYWVTHEMQSDKWHKVDERQVKVLLEIWDNVPDNIELTLSNDKTKVKKQIWKNNKPY